MRHTPSQEQATHGRTHHTLHLIYSFACNLLCGHCIHRCGPGDAPAMGLSRAQGYIRQAAGAGIRHIDLNGGEPFLDLSALHDLVRCAREHGVRTSVVTSGSWGVSRIRSVELLSALKRSGLEALTLSTDRYHLRFVPQRHVLNALEAARSVDLRVGVKIARLPWDPVADGLFRSVIRLAETVRVQEVTPLGRAASLREHLQLRPVFHLLRPGCNTPPVLLPDGRLLACCNLPARNMCADPSPFLLGSPDRQPLDTLLERHRKDPLLGFLRRHGPLGLYVPVLASAPGSAPPMPSLYHDGCDLCFHLFRHAWARDAARAHVQGAPGLGSGETTRPRTRNACHGFSQTQPRSPCTQTVTRAARENPGSGREYSRTGVP